MIAYGHLQIALRLAGQFGGCRFTEPPDQGFLSEPAACIDIHEALI